MLNKVILMGRLTANPELRQTPNGVSVATFSLAVERNYQQGGQRQTDFINIVAWRNTADFVSRYMTKGQLIAVEGSIQTRNYEDKSGNKRTAFEVVVDQAYFAESKRDTARQENNNFPIPNEINEPQKGTGFSIGDIGDYEEIDTDDDDLPF